MVLDNLSLSDGLLHLENPKVGHGTGRSYQQVRESSDRVLTLILRCQNTRPKTTTASQHFVWTRNPAGSHDIPTQHILCSVQPKHLLFPTVFLGRRAYLASVDPPPSALPKKAEYTEHSSLPSG